MKLFGRAKKGEMGEMFGDKNPELMKAAREALEEENRKVKGEVSAEKEEKISPRELIQAHRERIIELIRMEAEHSFIDKDLKSKAWLLKQEISRVENELKKAGYATTQIEDDRMVAQKEMDEAFQ